MLQKKPLLHILSVWRIRLLCATLVPSFLSALLWPNMRLIFWSFTAVWFCAFLYFYIFYYPIKFRKLSYTMNNKCLLVHCGVIYTRVKAVPLSSILYTGITSTPFERLFSVCTLAVFCAGSVVRMYGLSRPMANEIRDCLISESTGENFG